jgi:Holliday junction resolvase RusA-like endonuclease
MKQTIRGVCPSKSNCYRIGPKGLFKTKALSDYEKSFYLQCNHYRNQNITGLFEFYVDVYYPANRADLDNSLKVTLDCLQHVKAIRNDNLCTKIVAQKFVDKVNPRIEFELREV